MRLATLLFCCLASLAQAQLLQVQYQTGSTEAAPLTLTRLPNPQGSSPYPTPVTWRVEGLPFPGSVLWRPKLQQLAYQHPTEGSWLLLTSATVPQMPISRAKPGAVGKPWQNNKTMRWEVIADNKPCGALFTAASLTTTTGLAFDDLQKVFGWLYWLNTAQTPPTCAATTSLPALGLPTYWQGAFTPLVLQAVGIPAGALAYPTAQESWPTITYAPDANTRLRLLLAQLPLPARSAFLQQHAALPLLRQIEVLGSALAAEGTKAP